MSKVSQLHNRSRMKSRRRELRNSLTTAEARLWLQLQKRQLGGWKFRRQHSMGSYIVDFYCPAARMVIELDGAAHDSNCANVYDLNRSAFLASHGINVIRFLNEDVIGNLDGVLDCIRTMLCDHPGPSDHPSLTKEGRD